MRTRRPIVTATAMLLELGWWGTALLLVASIGFLLITPWVNPPNVEIGLAVPVAFSVNADVRATGGDVVHAYFQNTGGMLYFSPRSPAMAAQGIAGLVLMLAFVLFVLTQLRALFRTLKSGHPFVPVNATRIRLIGWAFIIGSVAWTLFGYAGSYYAATHFAADAVRLDTRVDIHTAAIVGGLIILAIAEVFREGTRLDEDQSLTV